MSQSSCAIIYCAISDIKRTKQSFDELLNNNFPFNEKLDQLTSTKRELEQKIEELENKIAPVKNFLNELKKEDTWEKIKECYREEITNGDWESYHADGTKLFFNIEKKFEKLPDLKKLKTQEEYEGFLEKFMRLNLDNQLNEIDLHLKSIFEKQGEWPDDYDRYVTRKGGKFLHNALHSIFLNKYLSKDAVITLDKPPNKLFDYFGCYLKKGTFNIIVVGDKAGLRLDGATLNVQSAGDELGLNMGDGVIRAKTAGHGAGSLMFGGTMRITEQVGSEFSAYVSDAVILADRLDNLDDVISRNPQNMIDSFSGVMLTSDKMSRIRDPYVIRYDEATGQYLNTKDFSRMPVTLNYDEYTRLHYSGENKFITAAFQAQKLALDRKMKGKIVVFRHAPKDVIGGNMNGGAIILEDPYLSVGEARKRISKDRYGGIILMRVPDPDKPGETKLIDLEMPDDWN